MPESPTLPANCSLVISEKPITREVSQFREDQGAVVEFHGVVRSGEAGKIIEGIEYEAFEGMARAQFARLMREAFSKWPIHQIHIHHRIGRVKAAEPSLYLRVCAGHRAEAFAAAQWIIDEMKRVVPIWKKPY
ncbi:molybdenum cofactor biosynthesis protein MoaE [Kamptonema cortianum]|uniref:Molybdenum cofactor biosynthesis protein MoaE n=1 Tax=Geitlerinema calcuttense NRMC-F 0142 TaxID=2922238 RepID=A0ABT7LX91_9CYAN|nr:MULTISPECIES: molybdenum cofactor biosynthesis protein MoaE [Cyanophyceae]MDK3156673.1 molybdenum cofactor biosynthesis protein MoaE [Kamptonema cortianum]MDL5050318.1 molybdenum cofactor biosynthesis protein MoaE [Oscillatoria amoena NRMC-F 0135]MDL5053410.1 molybdenum cofactor biosynthesis protein MoaE [Oscillatoria laete-virens NRMC-F 0139]MDL5056628.1 molybdenum cofactor biosynthesis protein MoaE [Geitlerinema calcuttense NRMC-F 0142]